jgi:hypothetical protein
MVLCQPASRSIRLFCLLFVPSIARGAPQKAGWWKNAFRTAYAVWYLICTPARGLRSACELCFTVGRRREREFFIQFVERALFEQKIII